MIIIFIIFDMVMKMNKKTLDDINQNIAATEELIGNYENKKEEIKSNPIPSWQLYSCEIIGGSSVTAIVSMNMLDLGAMIIGCMGGAAIGALVPYIVKQIKIGDLNYQIFMNSLIIKDLEKEKSKVSEKVKILHK